jgi:23S rRNA (adenine-N6)-dimethyltransferase
MFVKAFFGRDFGGAGWLLLRADKTGMGRCKAASLPLPGRPFRVVASPPYGVTSSLPGLLFAPGTQLVAADLVLQQAVVRKYAQRFGPLAGRRTHRYRVTAGLVLPRRAFEPPPRVDSAVLVVRRR